MLEALAVGSVDPSRLSQNKVGVLLRVEESEIDFSLLVVYATINMGSVPLRERHGTDRA